MAEVGEIQQLSDRDHILRIPTRYIGSAKRAPGYWFIYDESGSHLTELDTSEALFQTFKEPFSNMADHLIKARRKGYAEEANWVEIDVSEKVVRMRNGGYGIAVEIHPTLGIWGPTATFARLKTGSNFQEDEFANVEDEAEGETTKPKATKKTKKAKKTKDEVIEEMAATATKLKPKKGKASTHEDSDGAEETEAPKKKTKKAKKKSKKVVESDQEAEPVETSNVQVDFKAETPKKKKKKGESEDKESGNERFGAGRHGEGIKLVNVFSKWFEVTVGDKKRRRLFKQRWEKNMGVELEPEITEDYDGEAFVEIRYELDFKRFRTKGYSEQEIGYFKNLAATLSYTLRPLKVSFWDRTKSDDPEIFEVTKWQELGAMYLPVTEKEDLLHYSDENCEIIFGNTEEKIQVGIANHLITPEGGAHCEKVISIVGEEFLNRAKRQYIESIAGKKAGEKAAKLQEGKKKVKGAPRKARKTKEQKAAEKDEDIETLLKTAGHLFTIAKIKQHLSFIIICKVTNAEWGGGQIKSTLKEYPHELIIPKELMERMATPPWHFYLFLLQTIDRKMATELKKIDGKPGAKRVYLNAGEQEAGWAPSPEAWCFLIEGKSAAQLPKTLRGLIEDGTKKIGYYPLRGKPINPIDVPVKRLITNRIIKHLAQFFGLKFGLDYTVEKNFKGVRYGRVIIMADQDDDGEHIRMLVYNIFHTRWPTLLQREPAFLWVMETPRYVMKRGKQMEIIYTEEDYAKFMEEHPKGWKPDYKKGLAALEQHEIRFMVESGLLFRQMVRDKRTDRMMQMIFHPKLTDMRKDWLLTQRPVSDLMKKNLKISEFFNSRFIHFAKTSLIRGIPGWDGLKPSQRKAVYGAILKWGYHPKGEVKTKVGQFANFVMEKTHYHLGPTSITDAIVRQAWDFVGKNNLNHFKPAGLFGSRDAGGKDQGATRYVGTQPMPYFGYIYRKEDEPLLRQMLVDVDGDKAEPEIMLPVIPMALVNGAEGVGWGWSTFIPDYDPRKVIASLIAILNGEVPETLSPWYRGYTGEIEIRLTGKKRRKVYTAEEATEASKNKKDREERKEKEEKQAKEETEPVDREDKEDKDDRDPIGEVDDDEGEPELPDEDEVLIDENTTQIMVTSGKFERLGMDSVRVTELPIGRWTQNYKKTLVEMKEKGQISDFDEDCTDSVVDFTLYGVKSIELKDLKLQKSIGLSNMHLIGSSGLVERYESPEELLLAFIDARLPWYQKRKQYQLDEMRRKVAEFDQKIQLIKLVAVKRTLEIRERDEGELDAEIVSHNLDPKVFDTIKGRDFTKQKIEQYRAEKKAMKEAIKNLEATEPKDIWISELQELAEKVNKHLDSAPSSDNPKGKGRKKRNSRKAKTE